MILGYHRVHTEAGPLSIRPDTFRAHLEALAADPAISVIGLTGLCDAVQAGSDCTCVALTFDDAYADTLEMAAPMLEEFGFPATVFAPSGLLGTAGKMSADQLKGLLTSGLFEVGAHSRTHVDLRACGAVRLAEEVRGSKTDLETALGLEIRTFAYPFGALDRRVRAAVEAAGFNGAVTTRRAWVRRRSDPLALPRNFVGDYRGAAFRAVVNGGLNYLAALDRPRPPASTAA